MLEGGICPPRDEGLYNHNTVQEQIDRSDRHNYRGISLLCIAGKLFARVALYRLQKLAERVYPESQCGFCSNRSAVYIIFSLRQLQEKCKEQQQPLYIALLIDLTKAFNFVSRDASSRSCPKLVALQNS